MILVTGATGLVGSHLILALSQKGLTVRAIYRTAEAKVKTQNLFEYYKKLHLLDVIQWVEADILDVPALEEAFEGVTQVYHCAAKISFDPSDEEVMRKVNIEGTANMVNFALDFGVEKFCYVSSIATLGDLVISGKPIDEQDNWNPEKLHSDYAISKYGAEMEVWRAQEEGLKVVIVNPGVILGPGFMEEGSGKIITKVRNGLSFYTEGSTGFVGVQDVVNCMLVLMEQNIFGERFILVSENLKYLDLMKIIANKYQVKVPSKKVGPFLTELAWKLDWLASNVFFTKRRFPKAIARSLHTNDVYTNLKITQKIQIQFETIKEVIERM